MTQSVAESFASLIGEGPEAFLQRDPSEVHDEVREVAATKAEASLPPIPIPVEEKASKVEADEAKDPVPEVVRDDLPDEEEVPVEVEEERAEAVVASSAEQLPVELQPSVESPPIMASESVVKSNGSGVGDHRDVEEEESVVKEVTVAPVETKISEVEEDVIVEAKKAQSSELPPDAETNAAQKSSSLHEESLKSGEQSLGSFEPISFPVSTGDHEPMWSMLEASGSSPVSYELVSEPSVSTSSVTSEASGNFHSSSEDSDSAKESLDKIMTFTKELIASGATSMVADALIEQSVERLMGDFSKVEAATAETNGKNVDEVNSFDQPPQAASEETPNKNNHPSDEDKVSEGTTAMTNVTEEMSGSESDLENANVARETSADRPGVDLLEKAASAASVPEMSNVLNVTESNEVSVLAI